jgi:hypothetical protein
VQLSRQLRELNEAIDTSAKMLMGDGGSGTRGSADVLVSAIQRACADLGGLSCDVETTNSRTDRARSYTIVIGSEGELACFVLEATIAAGDDGAVVVDTVATTFQFGEAEWSSTEVDADVRGLLERGAIGTFGVRLTHLVALENLANAHPERPDLCGLRDRVRQAFAGAGAVRDFFDGPGSVYAQRSYDPVASKAPQEFTIRLETIFFIFKYIF